MIKKNNEFKYILVNAFLYIYKFFNYSVFLNLPNQFFWSPWQYNKAKILLMHVKEINRVELKFNVTLALAIKPEGSF